jgi:hypothetical protein
MTETDACIGWPQEEMNSLFPGIQRFSLQTPSLVIEQGRLRGSNWDSSITSGNGETHSCGAVSRFFSDKFDFSLVCTYQSKKVLRPEDLRRCLDSTVTVTAGRSCIDPDAFVYLQVKWRNCGASVQENTSTIKINKIVSPSRTICLLEGFWF